jgi:hypothetical protein
LPPENNNIEDRYHLLTVSLFPTVSNRILSVMMRSSLADERRQCPRPILPCKNLPGPMSIATVSFVNIVAVTALRPKRIIMATDVFDGVIIVEYHHDVWQDIQDSMNALLRYTKLASPKDRAVGR